VSKADKRVTIEGDLKPIKRLRVSVPFAPLLRRRDIFKGLESQLIFGTLFDVYKEDGDWVWGQEVQDGYPGYIGYIPRLVLSEYSDNSTHRVCVLKAPVFPEPDLKNVTGFLLPLNAKVTINRKDGKYLFDESIGYIHSNHVSALSERSGDYVKFAELHFGLPYIWGGVSSDGLDCSGLVQSSLRAVGLDAPRDSDMQEQALGKTINPENGLERGDLVFWKGHVGIMTNSETLLHANAHHMTVFREPLNEATRRIQKTAGPITSIKRMS